MATELSFEAESGKAFGDISFGPSDKLGFFGGPCFGETVEQMLGGVEVRGL